MITLVMYCCCAAPQRGASQTAENIILTVACTLSVPALPARSHFHKFNKTPRDKTLYLRISLKRTAVRQLYPQWQVDITLPEETWPKSSTVGHYSCLLTSTWFVREGAWGAGSVMLDTPPGTTEGCARTPQNNFWERFSIDLYSFYYNSTIPLHSRGFAHPWSPQGISHLNIQYFFAPKPLNINHISCSENALKLTYSNVEFKRFPGEDPRTPRFKGSWGERRGEGGKRGKVSGNRGKLRHGFYGWTFLVGGVISR